MAASLFCMKLLSFLIVILLKSKLCSTSFAYQIVNGSLEDALRMNFSIFTSQFEGMILYCFDSRNNQFAIKVGNVNQNVNSFNIKFNKERKDVTLSNLCGCDSCDKRKLAFRIETKKNLLNLTCNNHHSESFQLIYKDDKTHPEAIDKAYLMPRDIVNANDSMYVMMGNIGPYVTINGTNQLPMVPQMIGCVDSFYYNDILVPLSSVGDKVKTWCPTMCSKNPCNGGLCRQLSWDKVTCDCSNVAFNGRYCNNTLRNYHRGRDTSLNMKKDVTGMYVKMTWRTLISRYCLVEIFHESVEYNDYLLLDSSSLNNNNNDNNLFANFIIVNITNTYSFIRINNRTSKIDFTFSRHMRINIGFSERSSCAVFEGAYDLLYENLKIIPGGSSSANQMTRTSQGVSSSKYHYQMLINVGIGVGSLVLISVIVTVLYFRYKTNIAIITAQSTATLDNISRVLTESGQYGKVEDIMTYDYILDNDDVYATINL